MNSVSLVDGHIDEPKLTDEQIIKALECCLTENGNDCDNCSYSGVTYKQGEGGCSNKLTRDALDLINRQSAKIEESYDAHIRTAAEKDTEIESLKQSAEQLDRANLQLMAILQTAQAEARKEFAERLKEKAIAIHKSIDGNYLYEISNNFIDKVLKEMDGDKS